LLIAVRAGYSDIGWDPREGKYTAEAATKVAKPSIVKLSDMNTENPFLTGQGVTRLHRLAGDGETTWLAEQAAAGNVILWTFFNARKGGPPSAVLVSTKTYEFFGPVSFTDLYTCTPNSPGRRQ
jgi:hypothetical protein